MDEQFHIEHLPNGVTLLGQSMKDVSSAAVTFAVPAGAAYDPPASAGAAAVISEWVMRGAGDRDTRALNDALDNLGCQHEASVVGEFVQLSSAQLGRNLAEAMEILVDILRRPRLEGATFAPARSLILQDLQSLDDEPARKAVMMLREKFYPSPLGRSIYGTVESLESLDAAPLEAYARGALGPRGTIVAVAGNIDWPAFADQARRLMGDWQAPGPAAPAVKAPQGGVTHIERDSAQMHITLGHKACPASDDRYYAAHLAETVLSGGMSSRLFTHVREERGLAYHVSTHYHSLKQHAGMFTYAGTVPEKAQETLDVTVRELKRIIEGIADDEMHRAKTQYKSATVMAGESTSARAFSLAGDWFHLGRLRSLDETIAAIDAVSVGDVLDYVREFPAANFTVMTIGPRALDTSALQEDTMEFKQTQLGNALQVVAEIKPSAASLAVGFFVRTGSRDETPAISGVSHFLEHMVFKGTEKRSPFEVNRQFDQMGARYNAFTSEESTVFYGAVVPEFQAPLVELLGDILRPSLRVKDFDMEKNVILDEIARYEDQPQFKAYEKLMGQFFRGHPLGNNVLGSPESIRALKRDDMQAYFDRRYSAGNVVVAATGNLDFDALVAGVEKACGHWKQFDVTRDTPPVRGNTDQTVIADAKMVHENIALMSAAPSAQDEDRYAAQLLSAIIGDSTGSRLYYALIEPALADQASMSFDGMDRAGAFLTFVSARPDRADDALKITRGVLADFCKDGSAEAELQAAKNKIASGATLKGEVPMGRLTSVGLGWVYRHEYVPLPEQIDRLFEVTTGEITELARRYDLSAVSVLALGPRESL